MENQTDILSRYVDLLAKWNQEFHFSKFDTPDDLTKNLVSPSLALSSLLPSNTRVVDLGAGPGIPGIPIAIIRPDIEVICLDSSENAMEFVTFCRETLGTANISSISGRAEALAHEADYRASFDAAIARAFTSMPIVVEIASGFVKTDSPIIIQCSEHTSSILQANDSLTLKLGCMFDRVGSAHSSIDDASTNFVIFRKIADTPSRFPRSWPGMKRQPIWK